MKRNTGRGMGSDPIESVGAGRVLMSMQNSTPTSGCISNYGCYNENKT